MVRTLLCVEDEPLILKSLQTILTAHGYRVLSAETGEEALEKFASEQVDAVLLDHHLPRMSGLEVMKSMREMNPRVPIIFCTGDWLGSELKPDAVLLKPTPPPEMLAKLAELLQRASEACA